MRNVVLAGVAGVVAAASASGAVVYSSLATFLPNLVGPYYLEDFNSLSNNDLSLDFGPVNGYSFTALAFDGLGNYSGGGETFLSTNQPDDTLLVLFTGAPVNVSGFDLRENDITGSPTAGDVHIELTDGTTVDLIGVAFDEFRGFVSAVAIVGFTVDSYTDELYPGIDNLYVGTDGFVVPLPSAAGLGLAGLAALGARRRR